MDRYTTSYTLRPNGSAVVMLDGKTIDHYSDRATADSYAAYMNTRLAQRPTCPECDTSDTTTVHLDGSWTCGRCFMARA